jgi:hypothetical protein
MDSIGLNYFFLLLLYDKINQILKDKILKNSIKTQH